MRALVIVAALATLALPPPSAAAADGSQQNPFARLFIAQSFGTVAGTVRDVVSGAPLPGATVEVANPALIEKTRTAVTNGAGEYTVVDLPVGSYAVTFSLAGFNTLHREGVEVAAGATTKVNGKLKVWSIPEAATGRPPVPQPNPLPSQTIVCGMTIIQGGATLDAKMAHHPPANAPKPMIKVFPAPACQK
jgi:hypothetical protein